MKMLKRFLALALVLTLTMGLLPFSAFAADNASEPAETTEVLSEDAQELALTKKPAGGTTEGQPFAKGTGGSQNFRIPGLVTLDNGRIVASCDARWNHTGDGAGLDTIVSSSTDNGKTWHYTFANYLGDNGNTYNEYSTSFIDPAIGTDGKTVYMIVDLFPAGIALNTSKWSPVAGKNGLDSQDRLLLRENTLDVTDWNYNTKAANASYNYYLEDGKICKNDGSVVDGYTVDAYFNITGKNVNTNLFCADSPFQPYPTNYLYLTSSTDGQNWSAPQLLNLKNKDEQTLLVGPGNGAYDAKNDRLIFTAYEHTSGTERTSLIWKDAKGWHRSADANFVGEKSSEATSVVLADGTVRVFYRNLSNSLDYTDFTWNGSKYVPGKTGNVSKASKTQNNQLSAIKYSKLANGQELVLVSTAVGSGTSRVDGHIYAISVDGQNGMTLLNSYDVVSGSGDRYDYSCMTELNDGSIAILYENNVGNGEITYKTIAIQDIVGKDVQIGEPDKTVIDDATKVTVTAPGLTELSVSPAKAVPAPGYEQAIAYSIILNGGAYTGPATVKIPAGQLAECVSFIGHVDGEQFEVPAPVDGYFNVTVPHFSTVTISGANKKVTTDTFEMFVNDTVTKNQNDLKKELTSGNIQHSNPGIVDVNITAVPKTEGGRLEYTLSDKTTSITSGNQYVIASGDQMLVSNGAGKFTSVSKTNNPGENAIWTITKSGEFYHISQIIDGTTYYLYRSAASERESGKTRTYSYNLKFTDNPVETPNWRYDGGFYQNLVPGQTKKSFLGFSYWDDMSAESFYLTPGSSWSIDKNQATVDLYTVTSQEIGGSTTYDHTITFTGKQAGHTTVTIGDVVYDVTVKNQQKTVNLTIGQQLKFTCDGTITTNPDSKIATAEISGTNLVITGVAEGTTKVVAGGVEYTVNVTKVPVNPGIGDTVFIAGTGIGHQDKEEIVNGPVTKLTISKGLSYDLNLKNGLQADSWRIEDPNIAEVDKDGVVTGKNAGETRVYVTIDGVEYSIPVVVKDFNPGDNYRIYDFYASEITDTTVYYIWNNDSKLIPLTEGEAIYVNYDKSGNDCCNFFAAPDEGYALTRMSSTNSLGHYFLLHTGDHRTIDTKETGFVNGWVDGAQGAGVNQQKVWGNTPGTKLYNSVQAAIDAMCDGGMGFTRTPDGGDTNCRLTFRSEKLPTIDKKVLGVLGKDGRTYREYTPGMTAQVGEKVYYQITVEKYASQDQIDYKNVQIEDILNGQKPDGLELFKGDGQGRPGASLSNPAKITNEITGDGLGAGTHKYFAAYTITDADLDTTLVNKADLTYNYKSHYSSGAFDASASAEAKITATSFVPKDIVVDFGLPVTVHYDSWGTNGVLTDGEAKYGTVSVTGGRTEGWDVTYTPTTVLKGVDVVTLIGQTQTKAAAKYQFKVYPATTVYYEEGFAAMAGFTGGSKGNGKQQTQLVAESGKCAFGYDDQYAAETGMTNGTQAVSDAVNDTAQFTFTGTGAEIYANCDVTTGVLMVMVKDQATGKLAKFYQVDTRMKNGVSGGVGEQEFTAYSLPVVAVRDLPFGTYEVTIRHIQRNSQGLGGQVRLDGFRVYNTLNDLASSAYPESEKNPNFTELRDQLLDALSVDTKVTDSIYGTAQGIIDQVYNKGKGTAGAVLLGNRKNYSNAKIKDLLDNGPKNELFLHQDQVLTFNLTDNSQIGLKAVNGEVTFTINGTPKTINTSADMFYDVAAGNVTIKNTSPNVLSITLVKHFGTGSGFGEITQKQMVYALRSMGFQEPQVQADARLNISMVDYTGKQIAAAALTATGIKGEVHTFTGAQILETVEEQLPQGYGLVNATTADAVVLFGENGEVTVQIGLKASITVNFMKKTLRRPSGFFDWGGLFVKEKVGSITFEGVQTDAKGTFKVTAAQIRGAVPAGYRAGFGVKAQSVAFGQSKTVDVNVR